MIESDISLKTSVDVARMRRSCKIAEKTLVYLRDYVRPGITTSSLDEIACEFIMKNRAVPSLKGYQGFPGSICTSVNNVASHGIPSDYKLCEGDIITIDVTVSVDGWHGDAAWSYIAGCGKPDTRRLLAASWRATMAGIKCIHPGGRFGDIGFSIAEIAHKHGCAVMHDFVGHGIGKRMHEDPKVPHIGERGTGLPIVPGMVFTVEPILSLGSSDALIIEDGWQVVTRDNCLTAQFEHTIAVFSDRVEILTLSKENDK